MGEEESAESTAQLTDSEIEVLVQRYMREMARYEEAARFVEDRLRRALRASATRALLSSRAKHPDDLRGKLDRKRLDARYRFAVLDKDLNRVVTDLAGCRVMVYRFSDVEKAARAIKESFSLAPIDGAFEVHAKESGYRATHILVQIPPDEERMSLRGAVVEVQVTSLPAHVFNELEHDIGYKDDDVPPGEREREALMEVRWGAWMLDRSAERLMDERTAAVEEKTELLEDAMELRYRVEKAAEKPLSGDFSRLFRLLATVEPRVTLSVITKHGGVKDLLERGRMKASALLSSPPDDVVCLTLALFQSYPDEFAEQVQTWRGPSTLLKQAIEKAAAEGKRG